MTTIDNVFFYQVQANDTAVNPATDNLFAADERDELSKEQAEEFQALVVKESLARFPYHGGSTEKCHHQGQRYNGPKNSTFKHSGSYRGITESRPPGLGGIPSG